MQGFIRVKIVIKVVVVMVMVITMAMVNGDDCLEYEQMSVSKA